MYGVLWFWSAGGWEFFDADFSFLVIIVLFVIVHKIGGGLRALNNKQITLIKQIHDNIKCKVNF